MSHIARALYRIRHTTKHENTVIPITHITFTIKYIKAPQQSAAIQLSHPNVPTISRTLCQTILPSKTRTEITTEMIIATHTIHSYQQQEFACGAQLA
jgi:hypothetical protein